jgi:S1-C subfamily serine protease
MLLLLLGCLVSGEIGKDSIDVHIDKVDLQQCHSISENSQESSLKIVFAKEGAVIGHGSGNYFKLGKHRFVLTAAHVAISEYDLKVVDGGDLVELVLVYADIERDIAIMVPKKKLSSIRAHRWKVSDNLDMVGETVNYTGYPSHLGKVLLRGMVSAHNDYGFIMQSFALPGSSGSVVFDSRGRVLGVVSAVMMNHSGLSPFANLEENMVYVSGADFMDNEFIKEVLRCGGE